MTDVNNMDEMRLTSQLEGENSNYLESLYENFLHDPNSVEPSWRHYFEGLTAESGLQDRPHGPVREAFKMWSRQPRATVQAGASTGESAKVMALINAYRSVGHLHAKIDPLNMLTRPEPRELHLDFHGLSEADLNESFSIEGFNQTNPMSLKEIVVRCQQLYCGTVGFEYMHILDWEEKLWLRERIESDLKPYALTQDEQKWLLQRLVAADGLEKYLGMKYVGQKRFSLEGGDTLVPIIDELVHKGCDGGLKECVIGMAHRGRLNVLVNVMGKSPEGLFAEFEGKHAEELLSGDVKYHNGFSSDIETKGGKLHIALAFNPSHLEIVSPVAEGSTRARQDRRGGNFDQVMAILIHGDAAFAGQGVVMETLNMMQTRGFRTGGSVHIVINNQIGFTTSHPLDSRSTYYCTDVAKMIDAPIFHVNAEDPEAALKIIRMALEYRNTFHKHIVIDLVCYRRHGHNEADEPSATQPLMYQTIKKMPVTAQNYAEQLQAAKVIAAGDYEKAVETYKAALTAGKPVTQIISPAENKKFIVDWAQFIGKRWDQACKTSMPKKTLVSIAKKLDVLPKGFECQKQVGKTIADRAKMTDGELPLNWGYAEILAYATLLKEGFNVRLCGQDSERGTFAHRHSVLHDQKIGELYVPLKNISEKQGDFRVINSLLSEEAVMAFEYGYSSSSPHTLNIWEAQFGDFANGAQVVIDQFLCAGEEKWGRLTGLTLLLPHGQEGMGAEHSSARLERYLQLCANNNMQVCVPTTPAQLYHMLRRQAVRNHRKPLIVMTPKSLLRHPMVVSTMDDLADGQFELAIAEIDKLPAKSCKRVVLCQGKVYYDLLAKRREEKIKDIAILRVEQLYPFPEERMKKLLKPYEHVKDIVWCQEEPKNQGAWFWIQPHLEELLVKSQKLQYVGRAPFAAPAVGYPHLAHQQQTELVETALKLKRK